jgi:hypothetical protein
LDVIVPKGKPPFIGGLGRAGYQCRDARHHLAAISVMRREACPAPQITRWRLILSAAFQYFLRGKVLGSTSRLAEATG